MVIAFIGIGSLIHGQQKENDIIKQQLDELFTEPSRRPKEQTPQKQLAVIDKDKTKIEIRQKAWEGFTIAETAQINLAARTMFTHHGHIDWDGLMSDQREGKPLNGLCWLCEKPRFQKGE